jgi:hypothetical protein
MSDQLFNYDPSNLVNLIRALEARITTLEGREIRLEGLDEIADDTGELNANIIHITDDDDTERGRIGLLEGFLDYTTDLYGGAFGDLDGYWAYDQVNGMRLKAKGITLTKNVVPEDETVSVDEGYSYVVGSNLEVSGDLYIDGELILIG